MRSRRRKEEHGPRVAARACFRQMPIDCRHIVQALLFGHTAPKTDAFGLWCCTREGGKQRNTAFSCASAAIVPFDNTVLRALCALCAGCVCWM